jgi:N-acetylglutamate synthase-like GNAT family acetyltransferase
MPIMAQPIMRVNLKLVGLMKRTSPLPQQQRARIIAPRPLEDVQQMNNQQRQLQPLRPATATDQAAIKALIRSVGINPLGLDWRRFLVGVDEDGRLLGCGQIKPHGDGTRELASVAVVPELRRRGLARSIIYALQEQAGPPLWLTCTATLVPFYQPFGFQQITDPAAMSPHFRRLHHLARIFFKLSPQSGELAVMKWSDQDGTVHN